MGRKGNGMRCLLGVIGFLLTVWATASFGFAGEGGAQDILVRSEGFEDKAELALKSAEYLLDEVVANYPDTPEAERAREKLAAIRSALASLADEPKASPVSLPAGGFQAGSGGILSEGELKAIVQRIEALYAEDAFESLFVADMQCKTLMACLPADAVGEMVEQARELCRTIDGKMKKKTGRRDALPASRGALRNKYLLQGSLEKWINAPPEETDAMAPLPESSSESLIYQYRAEPEY